ncbi:MAG: anthranilate synthase component I family protein, partial [Thermoanaerobaculia bacterium]|nr:anthranilate synthase component I family protein [Thermoanaerobaculia bacterium]
GSAFSQFQRFYDTKQDWLFGFFGYDLKNEVEKLHSQNPDGIGLPDMFFFQPEIVIGLRIADYPEASGRIADYFGQPLGSVTVSDIDQDKVPAPCLLEIFSLQPEVESVLQEILNILPHPGSAQSAPELYYNPQSVPRPRDNPQSAIHLTPRLPKPGYLDTVDAIRRHIIEGDLYEMNLCQEFYAENAVIDPLQTFRRLNGLARAPFSAYLRCNDRYLLCASPERFLCKEGAQLVSQPIKGTRRRHPDAEADARIREELRGSEKDRAENVMIVDLVRNDLARNCLPGTVKVEELFGIYSFPTVHQMISTVCGTLRPEVHPVEALRDAFPMGSMTGAPKVMAMELIERYERTRRGLFSGAVGYFSPDGNFDFNVVIRSILYNAANHYLSCQVGGAIVFDSVPEQEYGECLVKMEAMKKALMMSDE